MDSHMVVFPKDFRLFSPSGIAFAVGLFFILVLISAAYSAIYNLYLHPLAHVPGPFSARASNIPLTLYQRNGKIIPWLQEAHREYGDAVRIAPNEVSFISGETAWQDIYGFRGGKSKTPPYLKDRKWYPPPINGSYSLIAADEAGHSRMRRNLSHAFSDKALREQEPLIQGLIDLLIDRLHEEVAANKPAVDIMRWYNYTTFDVITDLTYGEPLYCLRDKGYHPWVNLVFASVKAIGFIAAKQRFPLFAAYDKVTSAFTDKEAAQRQRREFFNVVQSKVSKRIEQGTQRPDFMSHILRNSELGTSEKALTRPEMDSNASLFMIAGSETTATLLSGFTYLILANPEVYQKLVAEIRTKFQKADQITIEEVNKMEYLIACLQEALRYYPPVPTGFARAVPAGGDHISGVYVPEGASVYMSQYPANHSSRNWTDPDAFVPERWMGDERYKDDNHASMNAFSFGPRNCLGKNLAYAEMRLIAAKVLFNFDLELQDAFTDWMEGQKVFTLWEKPSLMVKLHPFQR